MSRGNFKFAEYAGGNEVDPLRSASDSYDLSRDLQNRLIGPDGRPICRTDQNNKLVDSDGRLGAAIPYTDAAGEAVIWFPMNETSGSLIVDASGNHSGQINGGSYTKRFGAGLRPGITFNGTNNRIPINQGSQAGFTNAVRRIGDFKSLSHGVDMTILWACIGHPASAPAADYAVWSYGLNADAAAKGGWAVGTKITNGKPMIWYCAKGGTTVATQIGTTGLRGQSSDNTRTVMVWELLPSINNTYLEVRAYQLTLFTDGGNGQSNTGTETISLLPNGTGKVNYDTTSPLMLGAWFDTTTGNQTKVIGTGTYLWNCGAIRRTYEPSIGMKVCRDIRANPFAFPASIR